MKNAYVTLMYGDNDYFLGTLIFIASLLKTKPKHDTVLLYTFDVPKYKIDILSKYYTVTKEIKYIRFKNKKTNRARFKDIFTKLKIFTLTEYDNILFMDNDMYVKKNIDNIFKKYEAPAGIAIDPNMIYKDGEKIKKNNVVINAGLWLLKPSIKDYDKMIEGLSSFNIKKELEQEYVSYFYNGKWTNISFLYNFQFSLASLPSTMKRTNVYKNVKFDDVYVIHYSSPKKPWHFLLDKRFRNTNPWFKQYYKYYGIWLHLFLKIYKKFIKKNINLLDLTKMFDDINKYFRSRYKNLKIINLNTNQIEKLNNKLEEIIPNSNRKGRDYTYNFIINKLKQNNSKIYITGGIVRNLFNDEKMKDLDICYSISYDKVKTIFKNIKNLNYYQGFNLKSYFRIGDINNNEMDLFNVNKLDSYKNSSANSMVIDLNNMKVLDLYGTGKKEAEEKIFRKPSNMSYDIWLSSGGSSNVKLGRLIKFIMLKYKTSKRDRKMIYNDWYYNKIREDYNNLKKYFKDDRKKKLGIIKKDINSLKLKFTGEDFVKHFNSMMS
jgi:alpha-N-acetylglucosamine transferase